MHTPSSSISKPFQKVSKLHKPVGQIQFELFISKFNEEIRGIKKIYGGWRAVNCGFGEES